MTPIVCRNCEHEELRFDFMDPYRDQNGRLSIALYLMPTGECHWKLRNFLTRCMYQSQASRCSVHFHRYPTMEGRLSECCPYFSRADECGPRSSPRTPLLPLHLFSLSSTQMYLPRPLGIRVMELTDKQPIIPWLGICHGQAVISFSLRILPWYPIPSDVGQCFVLGAYESSGTLSLGICSLESAPEVIVGAQLGDTTGIAASWDKSDSSCTGKTCRDIREAFEFIFLWESHFFSFHRDA